jgi:hypothetical protein
MATQKSLAEGQKQRLLLRLSSAYFIIDLASNNISKLPHENLEQEARRADLGE